MISCCGIDCPVCPAYIATRHGDAEALRKVAEDWSKEFGMEIAPESVACDGCVSDSGRVSGYCSICAVRACALGKGVSTCAHCADYACETLLACPAYSHGRDTLEKIRSELA